VLTSAGLGEINRDVYALSIPMAFSDYDEVYAVLARMRPKLEADFEAKGFVMLNWADGGWNHFFSKSPAATPDEMRKLKMFSWAGDPKSTEAWKKMGFDPRPAPSTELVTGLQTGLFESFLAPPQVALITRYYEQTKYMTDMRWQILMGGTVIRKDTWEKIPADLRPKLLEIARNAGDKLQKSIAQGQQRDVDAMKRTGLVVVPVDARARDAWRRATETAYPIMRGGAVPAGAFDDALRYRDEYRRQKGAAKK
jgi:TRAP-type C4-dicarboxylate transport system substrate-binding protein